MAALLTVFDGTALVYSRALQRYRFVFRMRESLGVAMRWEDGGGEAMSVQVCVGGLEVVVGTGNVSFGGLEMGDSLGLCR